MILKKLSVWGLQCYIFCLSHRLWDKCFKILQFYFLSNIFLVEWVDMWLIPCQLWKRDNPPPHYCCTRCSRGNPQRNGKTHIHTGRWRRAGSNANQMGHFDILECKLGFYRDACALPPVTDVWGCIALHSGHKMLAQSQIDPKDRGLWRSHQDWCQLKKLHNMRVAS